MPLESLTKHLRGPMFAEPLIALKFKDTQNKAIKIQLRETTASNFTRKNEKLENAVVYSILFIIKIYL